MASKTSSSAKRAGRAPPVLEKKRRPSPEVLDPRKDISKKKEGGTSSSATAVLERPPPTSFVIFMLDFMKSKECESVVIKAAEDKWNSMSEAEKGPYERKALETCAALDKAVESYETMMNARKATPAAAAPPREEKLSEAATTGGPVEQ
ncbi:DNA-binding protein MNB1B-like [Syzygium oleosum]|uniref:DNA-binding protein MNB1B-like n=1 Tax=Syzygium oleosum TaxID=219896 RepID=UPI0011D2B274|nr:DNA-binding protein MNB1B-like [Syzygium oleosum]